jgi:hypothetical protein
VNSIDSFFARVGGYEQALVFDGISVTVSWQQIKDRTI